MKMFDVSLLMDVFATSEASFFLVTKNMRGFIGERGHWCVFRFWPQQRNQLESIPSPPQFKNNIYLPEWILSRILHSHCPSWTLDNDVRNSNQQPLDESAISSFCREKFRNPIMNANLVSQKLISL